MLQTNTNKMSINKQCSSSTVLTAIDSERALLGASMTRMEIAISSVGITTKNISADRSRIKDTDFAQANSQPQIVLSLLS